jgi:SAM-dependent methyltransferase
MTTGDTDSTRRSWNVATRNHNAHKGDQAAFLRSGGDTVFEEELALLGALAERRLVHLQCNSGQDTLCLARRGADATGVDFSEEAIDFARKLAADSGIPAGFVLAELPVWMEQTAERFDLAFSSYGAVGWMPDLDRWARGIARILVPGGRFVYAEFHPLIWCLGDDLTLTGDDYFHRGPYVAPVEDYVADSRGGLRGAVALDQSLENTIPASSWQYGVGEIVTALIGAGLVLETLREYAHSNGYRPNPLFIMDDSRRWQWPPGFARFPLMFGLAAKKP